MTDTPVVERPFPVSGLQIQMRAGDQKKDIVFSTVISSDCDDASLNELMDRMTRAVDREKLKQEKADLEATLRRNRELLASGKLDKDIDRLRRQRADADKVHVMSHIASGRRGSHKPSERQKTALAQFDQQIEVAMRAKVDLEAGLPITEYQIACLGARIADRPEPEMPEAVRAALRQIELPEDVSFSQATGAASSMSSVAGAPRAA